MSKLKLNDKVEVVRDLKLYDLKTGEQGIIKSKLIDEEYYAIEFPNFIDEHSEFLHVCDGYVPNGKGLYINEEDLRKI